MITRRDKLLKNPWEQRKYENHLRKLNSAVPVIDNKPPVSRQHVSVKLKKRQMEIERMRQIENDNLILLRRINYVMNTNRVDNWNIPPQQTRYLSRVPLTCPSSRPTTSQSSTLSNISIRKPEEVLDANHNHLRKSKCLACSPHIIIPKAEISERVPWEEPKAIKVPMSRQRSKSLPVIKPIREQVQGGIQGPMGALKCASSHARLKSDIRLPKTVKLQKQHSLDAKAQKLVISSGSLKLCVKFPSDSHILIQNGVTEKTVFGNGNHTQHFAKFK